MDRSICSIEGCDAFIVARKLCRKHYMRQQRNGTTDLIPKPPTEPCAVEGCDAGGRRRKGLCDKHYRRLIRHGDVNHLERQRVSGNYLDRLMARVLVDENGCWIWQGQIDRHGRARFYRDDTKRTGLAHRLMYQEVIGPIPPGLELDHLCVVARCVNPAHLEPVTGAENRRRYTEFRRAQAKT